MTTTIEDRMTAVELRIGGIEKRMTAIEKLAAAKPAAASAKEPIEPLEDHHLDNDWADKVVLKDPPKWQGPTMAGKKFHECPAKWHKSSAGFFAWKAEKGKLEVPVRVRNDGKPWWEQDVFMAKLHAAWALRLEDAPAASPNAEKEVDDLLF